MGIVTLDELSERIDQLENHIVDSHNEIKNLTIALDAAKSYVDTLESSLCEHTDNIKKHEDRDASRYYRALANLKGTNE